jgi:hypothetical protein
MKKAQPIIIKVKKITVLTLLGFAILAISSSCSTSKYGRKKRNCTDCSRWSSIETAKQNFKNLKQITIYEMVNG